MVDLEVALDDIYDLQGQQQFLRGFLLLLRMAAVVAVAAVVRLIFLSEVVEEKFPAADGGLGIG